MIDVPNRQPDDRPPPRSTGRPLTISIHLAVSALVLTTILLTAAASSLLWWRTAEATSRQLASTINEQIVAAVRKEVSAIVGEARAAHTAIRTLFLQNVLDTREADKREFVFLSQLQSHSTISWVAFGWPDGSFFAAHKLGDGHLEMMEISLTDHPGQRRIDEYAVIPGDIEFEQRQFVPSDFRVVDQAWFKTGMGAEGPQWFKVLDHPIGQRPSIAFAGPIDVYQERQGVLAIIIEYTRFAHFLAQLEVGRTGTAFIFDSSEELIAAPDKDADELHPVRSQEALLPLARMVLAQAGDEGRKEAWRRRLTSQGEAYEVALTPLPFPGWSLATVIPEAEFLGPVETTLRRLIIGDAVMAFWGAPTAQQDHAVRCCRAALACRKAIEAAAVNDDQGHPLQIRIGINSGRMLVGNIGSELRLNYTVIGDAVNVASRLESANKQYGTLILIGAETRRLIRDAFIIREIDSIVVYGRTEELTVYELIGLAEVSGEDTAWITSYEEGLARYRRRDFSGAIIHFEAVLGGRPYDWPASLLLERCKRLQQSGVDEE